MKRKSIVIGGAFAAIIAVPVLAMGGHHHRMGAHDMGLTEPVKRTEMETKIKDRFAKADADRDGFITQTEIDAARTKMVAELRDQHFTTLDANKDGAISRAEFDARAQDRQARRRPMRDRMAIRGRGGMGGGMLMRADANSDGKVSLAEALAKPLARFDAADANKDGTLTPEERKAARGGWRDKRG
jgi:EF-hand domain pair/EF hand